MKLINFIIIAFATVCIFDPEDYLTGLKVPLFILLLSSIILAILAGKKSLNIDKNIYIVTLIFLLIPIIGLLITLLSGLSFNLGYSMLKGYLFIILLPFVCMLRINFIRPFSIVLACLSFVIIFVYILVQANPELYLPLAVFGNETGIMSIDERSYGGEDLWLQIYFVTSPMLVVSIAYFYTLQTQEKDFIKKNIFRLFFLSSIVAMIFAGSRNNLFAAIILPAILIFINYSRKDLLLPFYLSVSLILLPFLFPVLSILLSATEFSNSIKINLLKDYFAFFDNPFTLVFGQGLGSEVFWNAKNSYLHLSELTYFEIYRNFGLFGGTLILGGVLSPIYIYSKLKLNDELSRNILIAYIFYLIMCFTNPNYFSSLGMSCLIIIYSTFYLSKKNKMYESV